MTDSFLGKWQLDPAQNQYEVGTPPQDGLYTIEATATGYLFTIEWTAPDGKPMKVNYTATPDGVHYAYENPAIADSIATTRVNELTLDTETLKGGQVAAFARRLLSNDKNTMTVTQSGKTPDGTAFSNVSVYRRVG